MRTLWSTQTERVGDLPLPAGVLAAVDQDWAGGVMHAVAGY
jgi:hypothetical protein